MAELNTSPTPDSSRNVQTSNKRYFESDVTNEAENGTISREVKRHQPLPSDPPSPTLGQSSPRTADASASPVTDDRSFVVRNLAEGTTAADIESLLSPFSLDPPVVTFLSQGEALIEMEVGR